MDPLLAQISKRLAQLEASQWWPAARLKQWQLRRLEQLLAHARAHVPYYAESPRYAGPGAGRALSEESWRALPTISRMTVRDQFDRLRARAGVAPETLRARSSSGSTGEPLTILKESGYQAAFQPVRLRFLRSLPTDFAGKLVELRAVPADQAHLREIRRPQWQYPEALLYKTGESLLSNVFADAEAQARLLIEERPQYVVTTPANLQLLLKHFRSANQRVPGLRHVLTMGEQVDPGLFRECRETLGVPMYDLYGAAEVDYIAGSCPGHDNYHVFSELNYVEVIGDDGGACGPGETGRVVVTALHVLAMPLIRYDLGDYAEVGEPCPCGRGLPVLKSIAGKSRALLTLPSGKKRSSILGNRIFAKLDFVRRFQIAQTGLTRIEVRLVLRRPLADRERDDIVRQLTGQVGPDYTFEFKVLDEIPLGRTGKFMEFVSELGD